MRKNIFYKSYARLRMYITKIMIIKVATDATVAITITAFLSSSGGFRVNGLPEPLLVAIAEGVEKWRNAVVKGAVFVVFSLVAAPIVVVGVIVVLVVMVLTDAQGASFVCANRVIGS